jgi:uncharacterized protein
MQILVDADACPNVIKDILYRVADRLQIPLFLLANKLLRVPPSRFIRSIQVPAGFDVADQEIVRLAQAGDLIITSDLPLAAQVLEKGGFVLNPRGEFYTKDNIAQLLTMRHMMDTLRNSGVDTGGPAPIGQAERQQFANQLDRHLTRQIRPRG